ncbi:hypothetical protein [Bradyrhizobium viridifuturi]|nr:hypothetical protein [Bradyrhizobium viridifuturi]
MIDWSGRYAAARPASVIRITPADMAEGASRRIVTVTQITAP